MMADYKDQRLLQKNFVLWFTGLSGAGKSTLANCIYKELNKRNYASYLLDGDVMRSGLNNDLGFSRKDRSENLRRSGELAKCLVDAGLVVIAAFISPYKQHRERIRNNFCPDEFVEIYVKCCLETCETRDPKGLYKRARKGLIKEFTGISDPYEIPENPEVVVDTSKLSVYQCMAIIMNYLEIRKLI